ncbi:MAG: NEW3 domain-containing protein [Prolixibacteraceae bacterium]|nr:NEW3 domain-containing protein [Prolixibacteraceae bacterium]
MKIRTKILSMLIISLTSCFFFKNVVAGDSVYLYTPYTSVSVPPGESVDYSIDIINDGSDLQKVGISITGFPRGWDYTLKAGGYSVRQIAVLPGERKTLSLTVQVPMNVNKGNHSFNVVAGDMDIINLVVNVSEQGTFKTEFYSEQANMEGNSKSNFNFTTKLTNHTGEKQMYSLRSAPPRGWSVVFKPNYQQATAVEVEPNNTATINIEIKPPAVVEAGTYKIPVQAANSSTSADLELEVVITGSFDMELTTPTGLLSSDMTAGKQKRIELIIRNTGSSELENVVFRATKPKNWDVEFNPDTISNIAAGQNAQVYAVITADDKAIPGDYVTNITAQTPEVNKSIAFRISVKTPLLWGWLGIFIIALTIGVIYYLFRKYGRR